MNAAAVTGAVVVAVAAVVAAALHAHPPLLLAAPWLAAVHGRQKGKKPACTAHKQQ